MVVLREMSQTKQAWIKVCDDIMELDESKP